MSITWEASECTVAGWETEAQNKSFAKAWLADEREEAFEVF